MTWLALYFALEIGLMPAGTIETYDIGRTYENMLGGDCYATLETEILLWDMFFIGGDVRTEMNKMTTGKDFIPHTMNYGITFGMRIDPIEFGFRHRCIHPVIPWMRGQGVPMQWEGWYEEIYLRLELSN